MTITLESTTRIVDANGIACRVWEGSTSSGIPIFALIPRIAVHKDQDCSQFEAELEERRPPSDMAKDFFSLRMIL